MIVLLKQPFLLYIDIQIALMLQEKDVFVKKKRHEVGFCPFKLSYRCKRLNFE